jgi:hypothetical protein
LNHQPSAYETAALTIELRPRTFIYSIYTPHCIFAIVFLLLMEQQKHRRSMVSPEGFEPPTFSLGKSYSIQLNYGDIVMISCIFFLPNAEEKQKECRVGRKTRIELVTSGSQPDVFPLNYLRHRKIGCPPRIRTLYFPRSERDGQTYRLMGKTLFLLQNKKFGSPPRIRTLFFPTSKDGGQTYQLTGNRNFGDPDRTRTCICHYSLRS